jgi:hypothetical protein
MCSNAVAGLLDSNSGTFEMPSTYPMRSRTAAGKSDSARQDFFSNIPDWSAHCSRYIVGTRGKGEISTGTNHLGFCCVKDAPSASSTRAGG